MHALTILCTHYVPVCADKLLNFHNHIFENLRHMNSNKKPSQVNFLLINSSKYGMPTRESKEGFTKFIFYKCLMHSLTTLCNHYAPVCSDKLLNFHISIFKNLWHMNSNKKPSQVNFLWINICKYGMLNGESKEGFTKFFFSRWLMHS